jgi:hypothetical protein
MRAKCLADSMSGALSSHSVSVTYSRDSTVILCIRRVLIVDSRNNSDSKETT